MPCSGHSGKVTTAHESPLLAHPSVANCVGSPAMSFPSRLSSRRWVSRLIDAGSWPQHLRLRAQGPQAIENRLRIGQQIARQAAHGRRQLRLKHGRVQLCQGDHLIHTAAQALPCALILVVPKGPQPCLHTLSSRIPSPNQLQARQVAQLRNLLRNAKLAVGGQAAVVPRDQQLA